MKPTDFRNATFESIRDGLDNTRRHVYDAYYCCGPATTMQATLYLERNGPVISLLTVRPRTTELLQMGLLELAPDQPDPRNGRYQCTDRKRFEQIAAMRRAEEQLDMVWSDTKGTK